MTNKKDLEEKLQDLRHPHKNSFKRRRWEQEEREFDKYLEEELKKLGLDDDPISEIP